MKILLLALALVTGCVAPTKARVTAMIIGNAAILCDWSQTRGMNHGGAWDTGYHEANPLLGSNPSLGQINTANVLALVTNTALTFMLKPKWATAWSFGVAAAESANVLTQPSNPVWKWGSQGVCQ